MTEIKNIYQRVNSVMAEISYIKKESKKVNNQYTFVASDAVIAAVRPVLLRHGVLIVPTFFDISVDGNRTSCSVRLEVVNIDNPSDCITVSCAGFGQGIDPQDKGAGKAMTYAYKYALLKFFAFETGDGENNDDVEKYNTNHIPAQKEPKDISAKGLHDRLLKKAKGFIERDGLIQWLNLVAVRDARDELYNQDRQLSEQLEDAFDGLCNGK